MGTQKPSGGGGGGKGAGDVRAGGGYFELNLRDNLSKALDKIQAKVKTFGSFMSKIGTAGLAGGAALGAGPLGLLLGGGSRLAETAQLARQFEIPIQMMAKFQYAAKRAGVSVEEVMNDTRGRFTDLLQAAPLIDPRQAEAALQIQNDFRDALESLQDAMMPLLGMIAPLVRDVTQFVQANAGGVRIVAAASAGLLAFGAAAKVTGISLASIAGLVPLAFGAMVSPIGLAAIGVGGLTATFLTCTDTGQSMLGDLGKGVAVLGKGFDEFANTAKTAWGGIVAAFKQGDLEGAFEIVGAALKLEWTKIVLFWTETWAHFRDGWLADFRRGCDVIQSSRIVDVAKGTWDNFYGYVESGIESLIGGFEDFYDAVGIARGDARHPAAAAADAVAAGPAPAPAPKPEDPAIAKAKADIVAATDALNALTNKVKEAGAAVGGGGGETKFGGGMGAWMKMTRDQAEAALGDEEKQRLAKVDRLKQAMKGMEEIKGGFNMASAVGQFGYGSKAMEQTELMKALVEGKGALPGKIGKEVGAAVLAGMMLK